MFLCACGLFFFQLVNLCETESISYLDEVASSYRSMHLAKSVALEVVFVTGVDISAFFLLLFDQDCVVLNSGACISEECI